MGCFFLNYDDSTIYNMCTQKPPNDYSQQLYDKYKEAFQEHINSTVRILVDIFFLDLFVYAEYFLVYAFTSYAHCCCLLDVKDTKHMFSDTFISLIGVAMSKREAWWIFAQGAC